MTRGCLSKASNEDYLLHNIPHLFSVFRYMQVYSDDKNIAQNDGAEERAAILIVKILYLKKY